MTERRGQDFVRNIGHQAAQLVEAARSGIQPKQANQAPLAAHSVQRSRHWALGGEGQLRHIAIFCRRAGFHNVTRLPQSAFLLFRTSRDSMMQEPRMIIEMRTYKIKPGRRSEFVEIFRSKSIPAHTKIGMKLL